MVRKLAFAVSLALANLSVPVHALGLGDLSSKSALNQNFRGEIALLSVNPDDIESVRVKLADSDAFTRAGVDRPFYLSLLQFQPSLTSTGKPVIQVTSEFPIREPFLNFLVEVNWPNGRLLREYTVLLDPPTTTTRRAPTVTPAVKTAPAASAPAPAPVAAPKAAPLPAPRVAPAAVSSATGDVYGPVQASDTAWGIARRLRPTGVTMEQMMMALLEANPEAFVDNDINRLRRGRILRVPSMDEIQRRSRAEARAAYRAQQDNWLARRNADLQTAQPDSAPGAPDASGSDTPPPDDRLRIATARPEGSGEAGAGDDDAVSPVASELKERLIAARENAETSRQEAEVLRSQVDDLQVRLEKMQRLLSLKDEQLARLQDSVVVAEAETPAAAEAPVVAGEEPLDSVELANQVVPTGQPETEVATARTADQPASEEIVIEGDDKLADAARAIDDVVAELTGATQSSDREVEAIEDIAPQVDPDRIVSSYLAGAADQPAVEPVVESAVESTPAPSGDVGVAPGQEIVIEGGLNVAAPAVEAPEPALAEAPPPPAPIESPATAVIADTEPAPQATARGSNVLPPGLAALLEKNIVPVAAGGIALLGLLGWLFTRGRRSGDKDGAVGQKPADVGAADDVQLAQAVSDTTTGDAVLDAASADDLPDSSFLDEFSPSDINALQDETGEVDPVSEADVYIAYGRYQQAHELLRQAMERDPDRLALKHKLLEVHYATRDGAAFSAVAQDMVDRGQDAVDPLAWARAQDMGRELAPDNSLFAKSDDNRSAGIGKVAAVAAGGAINTVDRDTLSLDDLEISELTAAYEEEASNLNELDTPSEVSITLDLEEPPVHADAPQRSVLPESLSLDDLESLDFELPSADSETASADDGVPDDISDTLELDSMMKQAEAAIDLDDSTNALDSEFSAADLQAQLDEEFAQ